MDRNINMDIYYTYTHSILSKMTRRHICFEQSGRYFRHAYETIIIRL